MCDGSFWRVVCGCFRSGDGFQGRERSKHRSLKRTAEGVWEGLSGRSGSRREVAAKS